MGLLLCANMAFGQCDEAIELYFDSGHSDCAETGDMPFYEVELWIWTHPGPDGVMFAEFSLEYPMTIIQGQPIQNSAIISTFLGDLDYGVSVGFFTCQHDWLWIAHQHIWVNNPTPSYVEVEPHQDPHIEFICVGDCTPGFPAHEVYGSRAYFNYDTPPTPCGPAAPPDLVVSSGSPTVVPDEVPARGTVTYLTWTVLNQGCWDAHSFSNGYYLSPDATITASDILLAATPMVASLAGQADTTFTEVYLTIPEGTSPGDYYIGTLTDHLDQIDESDETNNFVSTPIKVIAVTDIDDIQQYNPASGDPESPYWALTVAVEGVVYVVNNTFNAGVHYLQDATGGIMLYIADPPPLDYGDRILVQGDVTAYHGELYITHHYMTFLGSEAEPSPAPHTISNLVSDYENVATFVTVVGYVTGKGMDRFYLHDGGDTLLVYIYPSTGIDLSDVDNDDFYQVMGPCAVWDGEIEVRPRKQSDLIEQVTGIEGEDLVALNNFLGQNYPNPFNPVTQITFALMRPQHVRLTVYSVTGSRVITLVDNVMPAGRHTAIWNGQDDQNRAVPSGIYFYRLAAGDFVQTKKMVLLR